jgi:hypothetical protein
LAARAFGADRVFFVTNGTSTSNQMVVQALLAPGDIAIIDRNCHKSHHYGMVMAGGQPLYVEAFPMTEYSMYGAVPLRSIKQALLTARAEGRLDRVKLLDLTNCTFDGHIYNTRRVMEECLAIKPDLIFLWDEAWFGFARWSPFLRPRTAMGVAGHIEEWLHGPASIAAYERQRAELGNNPSDAALLDARLVPDPRQMRLRVYQTNSTHKSMSALRQGSMILVKDVDYHKVESPADRQPRCRTAANGARRLWSGDERDRGRARHPPRSQQTSPYLQVLSCPWGGWHDPSRIPAERVCGLPRAGYQLGGRAAQHAEGRILPRSHADDPRLRNCGL